MSHHVFIERPRDPDPDASARLAAAIASRYGLPEGAIAQRLAAGRFRVKSNVDLPTARAFASELQRLGAVVAIVDAGTGQPIAGDPPAASAAAVPPVGLAAAGGARAGAAASSSALAGAAASTSAARDQSPLAGAAASTGAARDHSPLDGAAPRTAAAADDSTGLAAALGNASRSSQQDLGALAAEQGMSLAVSSLDGADDAAPATADAAFAPDEAAFAPPESDHDELKLAVDLRPASEPPAAAGEFLTLAPEGEPAPPAPPSAPRPASLPPAFAPEQAARTDAVSRARRALASDDRLRFTAGVLLILALGFLPAHLLASVREDSAYSQVRKEVRAAYAEVRTADQWHALDPYLAGQLDVMDSQRTNITVTSLLLWALVAAGLGFVWFRVIDWNRLAPD